MRKSPYNLLQEIYLGDVIDSQGIWRVFVCCMLLNRVTRDQVDKVRFELFRRWPDAQHMAQADFLDVEKVVRPLGLGTRRAKNLIRMSNDYLTKDWTDPRELWGLGQYAYDAYRIFVLGMDVENPSDKFLKVYMAWRRGTTDETALARARHFNVEK